MSSEEQRVFGARVADLREQRGLTQSELAAAIGRTASWLSQVEREIQPVNRLDVLRLLADGLGVPLQVLQPDAPPAAGPEPAAEAATNDLDQARLVLSGHPAVDVLLTPRGGLQAEHHAGSARSRRQDLGPDSHSPVRRTQRCTRTVGAQA
ncbi:helix-turn-helix domain-containing protein [Streptomyces sp. NPDC090442]|uniref:helix-turn-helix domain-containing protein n=1 Tax=Streptomyces sp. NPDC090442 TaxID=3365962 RepID=UPI003814DE33